MPSVYKIIKTKKQLRTLIKYCKATGYASVDFETNGVPINSPLFYPTILGVSFQIGSAWVIPLGHFDSPFKSNWVEILKEFCIEIIENTDIIKIAWGCKFEYKIFKKYGFEMKGIVLDAMYGKYILNELRPNGLKPNVDIYLPEFAGYSENYDGSKLPWDEKPLIGLSEYCALDCDLTFRLMLYFESKIIENNLYPLYRNMLMMGMRVLGDSEFAGMPIDEPYLEKLLVSYKYDISEKDEEIRNIKKLAKFQKWLVSHRIDLLIEKCEEEIKILKKEAKKAETEIIKNRKLKSIQGREDKIDRYYARELNTKKELECLEDINFNSPKQMGELLFFSPKGFEFKIVKYTIDKQKSETDTPSTDEEVLLVLKEKDKSGFCEKLLEYRGLTKLYSTYVKGMHEKVVEGRVHGRFLLEGTVTGRLSSREPNLQNIPRDTTAADIKKMFIPPPGYLLVQLDYSQAELRVMAAMANEETMIDWFRRGQDMHTSTALKKYGQEHRYDEIAEVLKLEDDNDPRFKEWKVKRKQAKTINFGIIYEQGAKKLSLALGCSIGEAKKYLREFFKTFPNVKKFINKQHRKVYKDSFVKNVFGRKRRLPDIYSTESWKQAEAERQSVNAPIQGAASDYTLFSSIIIWEECRKGNIDIQLPQCYTVHDSLGFFIKPEVIHSVIPKLQKICENPQTQEWFGFDIEGVTMKVDFEVSHENWGSLKSYDSAKDYRDLF